MKMLNKPNFGWMRLAMGAFMACALFLVHGHALAQPVNVFVSIAPQKYFVEQIGKDLVNVSVMVPAGASPHVYEPRPGQMRELAQACMYFTIGVNFEPPLLQKIQAMHQGLRIVDTTVGIRKMPMPVGHDHDPAHGQNPDLAHDHQARHEHEVHHEHEPHEHEPHEHEDFADAEHGQDHQQPADHGLEHARPATQLPQDQAGLDPHVWLSPDLVRIQAGNILDALKALDPDHGPRYETNYSHFLTRLDALDREIKEMLKAQAGAAFMVFHPSWGYFARHYGLVQLPIEVEGKEPGPRDLQNIIERAKTQGIKVIFVSPQFSTRAAETIAQAIDGQVMAIDPLTENWMRNMRAVAATFRHALQ